MQFGRDRVARLGRFSVTVPTPSATSTSTSISVPPRGVVPTGSRRRVGAPGERPSNATTRRSAPDSSTEPKHQPVMTTAARSTRFQVKRKEHVVHDRARPSQGDQGLTALPTSRCTVPGPHQRWSCRNTAQSPSPMWRSPKTINRSVHSFWSHPRRSRWSFGRGPLEIGQSRGAEPPAARPLHDAGGVHSAWSSA